MATDVIDVASLGAEPGGSTETPVDVDAGVVSSVEAPVGNQESQQVPRGTSGEDETPTDVTGKAVRDAIRRLSAQSPEDAKLLKQLADTHFREATGWKGAYQTPQEAMQAKSLIEAAGGPEAIAAAQTRLQAYDQQETGLESGDPAVLDSFFEDYPQGAAALAPHYLAKLESLNPQALAAAVGPYAVDLLTQAGVGGHLEALLKETDPAHIKAGIQTLNDWFKGQRATAQQVKLNGQPQKNPQADRLKQRETELNQKEEKIFRDSVSERVNSTVKEPITALVEQYGKQYKLNDTQKAHYRKSLEQAVIEEMNNDENYKRQAELRNASKSRTTEGIASFVSGEVSRRAKDKAFEIAKAIYGAPRGTPGPVPGAEKETTGVIKAGGPKTGPNGAPLFVTVKPTFEQMADYEGRDIDVIHGRVWTKAGYFVTWRKS